MPTAFGRDVGGTFPGYHFWAGMTDIHPTCRVRAEAGIPLPTYLVFGLGRPTKIAIYHIYMNFVPA